MSSDTETIITRTASCLCGSVQVSVTGVDIGAVLCHCSNCKQATGSTFAHNQRFLKAELTFLKGQDLCKQYADGATTSGNILNRHFCSNCGCPIYLTINNVEGLVALNAGNLDGERPKPFKELFLEDKYAWIGDVGANEQSTSSVY